MNHVFHVIKDPVHGTMQFTASENSWVKPFIDSPHFQRLRHIKQLGMGDFIFPGAVHTRFNHSIGCCYVASQVAQKIGLADEERQLVMIAALLHDIGHGPFSHAFEDIFKVRGIRHEEWTPHFLNDYANSTFFSKYNRRNAKLPLTETKFADVAGMIMHAPAQQGVLADIVSSQLDADRLDYLLRDSHFCGVRYGEFDFRWMLHCMTIVNTPTGKRLGITHKGIGVVEHYVMARRLMMRNIYHAQKKLALEKLLMMLLAAVAENLPLRAEYAALRETRLGQFLLAVNQFNTQNANAMDQKTHKAKFLAENYIHYKELCDYDVFALIKTLAESGGNATENQIAQRLQQRVMPKIIRLDGLDLVKIEAALNEFKEVQRIADWQLMINRTPHRSYSGEDDPILVVNEQAEIQPIEHYSVLIKAISDRLEHVAFLSVDRDLFADARIKAFIAHLQNSMT